MAEQDPHHCGPECKAQAVLPLHMDEMTESDFHILGTIHKRCPLTSRSSLSSREGG